MTKKAKITWILTGFVVGMFFFGFALVPLYNVLCKTLGINGKTNADSIANHSVIDTSRSIRVTFMAHVHSDLPWKFFPAKKNKDGKIGHLTSIEIHPGENVPIFYFAENDANKTMTVQAIPSVTPGLAAIHLKKTECFCFNQQTLKSKQKMEMPLIFHLDNQLPKNIHELTLSYTLYNATKSASAKPKGRIG